MMPRPTWISVAVQMVSLARLPLVLLAGITIWIWFPILCVVCGYLAGRT